MVQTTHKKNQKFQISIFIQTLVFATILLLLTIRAMQTEITGSSSAAALNDYIGLIWHTVMNFVPVICLLLWLGLNFLKRNFKYRFSMLEKGFAVFTAAAAISFFYASDKRAVLDNYCLFAGAVCGAILLTQLLSCESRRKILLVFLIALGILNSVECFNQYMSSNKTLIEQYEQDPQSQLNLLGIAPDTLEQWQYEHRLYSKDIKGFFTTSNSLGSFLILSGFACISMLISEIKKLHISKNFSGVIFLAAAGFIMFLAFTIAYSKGAIAAGLVFALCYLIWYTKTALIRKHRFAIFAIVCTAAVLGCLSAIIYGCESGTLPGGNSMFVRWQYWISSFGIFKDHPLIGIGPGNFAIYYPAYKIPAALETVSDPHNFILSIACQYGLIGLAGFIMMITMPLWKVIMNPAQLDETDIQKPIKSGTWKGYSVFIIFCILLIRPFLLKVETSDQLIVRIYILTVLYLIPLFVLGFSNWVINKETTINTQDNSFIIAGSVCSVMAVLMHNLIDFAIFEPSILMWTFAIIAFLVSCDSRSQTTRIRTIELSRKHQLTFSAITFTAAIVGTCFLVVFPARNLYLIDKALASSSSQRTLALLQMAGHADKTSDKSHSLSGKLCISLLNNEYDEEIFSIGQSSLTKACSLNPQTFKHYEDLGKLYYIKAQASMQKNSQYAVQTPDIAALQSARTYYLKAAQRYPGKEKIWLELGKICDLLGEAELAKQYYKKALEIDAQFKQQFQKLYKQEQPISRLSNTDYDFLLRKTHQ